ncbi:MAG: polysaccharide biosynthesis C-terminal domain-containing protein, partial [Muribaculaceae bacterium]|nr:polysaccharide biosynthesis C-terminal domain-containing protein [Muribaculaceae bacterium]
IYPLGVAAVLSALSSSFFDPIYQSANETHRAVPAVVLTAMISVGANCLLLPLLGLYGATVASIAAYSFLLVYRLIDTQRYIKLQIAPASLLPVALMAASAIPFFFSNSVVVDCSFAILAVAVLIFVCWRFLLTNHKETA